MSMRRQVVVAGFAVLLALPVRAIAPEPPALLLRDIRAGGDPSASFGPMELTPVGGALFFTSWTGDGLWKTDGTAAGTVLVKNLRLVQRLVNVNGTLFFQGDDGTHGGELWKSDGTTAGTVMVRDVRPGPADGPTSRVAVHGGVAYFAMSTATSAAGALWKSDGTEAGTVLVKDFSALGSDVFTPSVNAGFMLGAGPYLYFQAQEGANGQELWRTDGTEAGTVLVADLEPGAANSAPVPMFAKGGLLYFSAVEGQSARYLYVTDGSAAGTQLLTTAVQPDYPCLDHDAGAGVCHFRGYDSAAGVALWKTDGSSAGTVLVKDFNPASNDRFAYGPGEAERVGGQLFLAAGNALWKSDGTTAGTVLVSGAFTNPQRFTALGSELYFIASSGQSSDALWKSDGTEAGTVLVADLWPGGDANVGLTAVVGNRLLFSARDAVHGQELWVSDGTGAGTALLKDLRVEGGSGASAPVYLGGFAFFAADDGVSGRELWRTDGTEAGTVRVKDIAAGAGGSAPAELVARAGLLYFSADDGVAGRELWRSDGSEAGTLLVRDIAAGPASSSPAALTVVGANLYFAADDGVNGAEPWKSDGTEAGTALVADVAAGSTGSLTAEARIFGVGARALFWGSGTGGLWRTDGTGAGTLKIDSMAFFGSYGDIGGRANGVVSGGYLYYASQDLSLGTGLELFRTDGTTRQLVKDVMVASNSGPHSYPADFVAASGIVYFQAISENGGTNTGRELWKTDGTTAGTVQVAEIGPGGANAGIANLVALDGQVYFTASDGTHNAQALWVSDGTAGGTQLLKDIRVTALGAAPAAHRVFAAAFDPDRGDELWETDGTADGTQLLQDLRPGAAASAPQGFTMAGPWLLFSAEGEGTGREPWRLDLGAAVTEGPAGAVMATPERGAVRNFVAVAAPASAPATYEYPYGFYAFEVSGLAPGATVRVTLELPEGPTPTAYIKCSATACAPFAGARIEANRVTLTLVDGGSGDADGLADGTITDPGAPATPADVGGGGGGSGGGAAAPADAGGGGSTSGWLSLMLGILGAGRALLRQRRRGYFTN